jgi:hypothetical protein
MHRMGTIILIIIIIAIVLICIYFKQVSRFLSSLTRGKQFEAERIQTNEIIFIKPLDFALNNDIPQSPIYLEKFRFFSRRFKQSLALINGERVEESFNDAWGSVSVAEGLHLEAYRNAAKVDKTVLSESEERSTNGDEVTVLIHTTERSQLFEIQVIFKIIENQTRNRTYELVFCILGEVKAEYEPIIPQFLASFQKI